MSMSDTKQGEVGDDPTATSSMTLERLRQAAARRRAWAAERDAAKHRPAAHETPEILAAQARALEVQLESVNSLNARLEVMVREQSEAHSALEARVDELASALAERDGEYERAIEDQNSMLEELEARSSERDHLQAELSAALKEKAAQTERARAAEERVASLEVSDARLREELGSTSKSLVTMQSRVKEATASQQRLEKQLSELGEAHEAELAQELVRRDQQLALVLRERAELEQSAAAEAAHFEQELARAFEATRDAQREAQELVDVMEELREHAGAALHEHELRFAERTQERDEAAAIAAKLRSDLAVERERVACLRADITAMRGAIEEQLDQEESTHDREIELMDRIGELQQQLHSFTSLNSKLQITLDTLIRERDEIGKDSEFVLSELDRTQSRVGELERRNDELVVENNQLLMEADTLRRRIAESAEGSTLDAPPSGIDAVKLRQYEAEMLMARDIIAGLEEQCVRNEATIAALRGDLKNLPTPAQNEQAKGRPTKTRQPRRREPVVVEVAAKQRLEIVSA